MSRKKRTANWTIPPLSNRRASHHPNMEQRASSATSLPRWKRNTIFPKSRKDSQWKERQKDRTQRERAKKAKRARRARQAPQTKSSRLIGRTQHHNYSRPNRRRQNGRRD